MAKPRVFISSTFFDLRQVRADLDRFIKDLGYESVRNETGGIPYGSEDRLEDYCYKEISEVDILIGIVGGRIGSESENKGYSITQTEIKTALAQGKQVYIFIEKNVYSEYETYLINKETKNIKYKFVNDIRIYQFIEEIFLLPKNNVIHPFETAQDITLFLKEQWAGHFRDLLTHYSRKNQFENINQKVSELNEVATTIKKYMERMLNTVITDQGEATSLIKEEQQRLSEFHIKQQLLELTYINHLLGSHDLKYDSILEGFRSTTTLKELKSFFIPLSTSDSGTKYTYNCMKTPRNFKDINKAREILSLPPYPSLAQL